MKKKKHTIEELCKLYFEIVGDKIDESKYDINANKIDSFLEVYDYCSKIAKRKNGKVERVVTKRKNLPAQIMLRFVDDLIVGESKEEYNEFVDILTKCDAINISGTGLEDGSFLISFFIDDLYVHKK